MRNNVLYLNVILLYFNFNVGRKSLGGCQTALTPYISTAFGLRLDPRPAGAVLVRARELVWPPR